MAEGRPEERRQRVHITAKQFKDSDLPLLTSALRSLGKLPIIKGWERATEVAAPDYRDELRESLFLSSWHSGKLPWRNSVQLASYELYYALGERALPQLEKLAMLYTPYDCQSMNAAILLGLLATDGIAPARIAQTLRSHLHLVYSQEYEDFDFYLPTLGRLCAGCPAILDTVQAFFDTSYDASDPIGKFEDLSELAAACPEFVEKNSRFFEEIMMDRDPSSRREFMSVYDPSRPTISFEGKVFPLSPDSHAIDAALLLHRRYPERRDISAALNFWEQNHPLLPFRIMIQEGVGRERRLPAFPAWNQVRYSFFDEGALTDISIENVPESQMARLFECLASNTDTLTFSDEENEYPFPNDLQRWNQLQESGILFRAALDKFEFIIWILGHDLEIDLWQRTVNARNFGLLCRFVVEVGRALGRDVKVSDEGQAHKSFLVYEYHSDSIRVVHQHLIKRERLSSEELAELDQRDR